MKYNRLLYILFFAIIPAFVACHDEEEEPEEVTYSSATNTAVTSFTLRSDTILENLESVFFTIDLRGKRIFNADSLPVGTDVSRLRVSIGYPTDAKEVVIRMQGGEYKGDAELNYLESEYDSIDFTGKVFLKIVAQNEKDSTIYDVSVNVHKLNPDSIYWDQLAVKSLPSKDTPVEQKTVSYNGMVYSLIMTESGYKVYAIDNPILDNWVEHDVMFLFTPRINTFAATSDAFYILSNDGKLYRSEDACSWSIAPGSTQTYYNLYGGYTDKLLAVVKISDDEFYRAYMYSVDRGDVDLGEIPLRLPVDGFSQLATYESEAALDPQVVMVGGSDMFGEYSSACWGFDGDKWAQISASELPQMYGPMIIPYSRYKVDSRWIATKYDVLIAIGGRDAYDNTNKRVFYSYDNGVYWVEGSSLMQFPDYFPTVVGAQAIVSGVEYTRSDYSITWECPYIYVFGGTDLAGNLNNTIWRGVLNRLSFKPLI